MGQFLGHPVDSNRATSAIVNSEEYMKLNELKKNHVRCRQMIKLIIFGCKYFTFENKDWEVLCLKKYFVPEGEDASTQKKIVFPLI